MFLLTIFTTAALLAKLSVTAPATGSSHSQFEIFTINNNFETLTNDVPVLGTVGSAGVYNLLNWNFVGGDALKRRARRDVVGNGFEITAALAGVKPHSPPNSLSYAIRSKLENGTPSISVDYQTSTIDHFDLYVPDVGPMIYYGCDSDPDTDVAVPITCTITVKGYDQNNNELASQEFRFESQGGISQDMTPGYFSKDFVNLYRVEFSTDSPLDLFSTVLDNVWTRVYQKK